MRILAIRGENLASLAETFEIDFTAEPLANAGLFAITGETGAGKSTLLDALCLALYDEFPRVKAEGANETIPDGDGGTLPATDPRTILRRGAGRGYAEVLFSARDGRTYRVRCEINRARGKATGRLQARGRGLWRVLDDGTEEAVASDIKGVKAEVEALTELTCDQFRRTVLLAQGDFDAFLRADARERAELLEKITGTEVYAAISMRAYARWKTERDALSDLERRRAGIGLMAPEDREAAQTALAALLEEKSGIDAERKAVDAALQRHDAIAAATRKVEAARGELTTAREAADALGDIRARVAALARVEPLRGAWEKVLDAQTARDDGLAKQEAERKRLSLAQTTLERVAEEETRAREAFEAAKGLVATLEPEWAKAEELDSRLLSVRAAAGKAAQRLADMRGAAEQEQAAAAALAQKVQAAKAEFATLGETLVRDAALEPLATRFDELAEVLVRRAGFVRDAAALRTDERAARATLNRLAGTRAALDEADAADAQTRTGCDARMAEKSAALDALGLSAVRARAEALETADGLVVRLANAAEKAAAATASRDTALRRREAAVAAWTAARDAIRATEAEIADGAVRADEVGRLGALADATASDHARRLRAALVVGEPCPVCGVPHEASAVPDAFVDALRTRADALRRDLDAARGRLADAKAKAEVAEKSGKDAAEGIAAEETRLEAANTAYAEAYQAWRTLPDLGLATPPDSASEAGQVLADLGRAVAEARGAARETLRKGDILRGEIEAERTRRDGANAAIEARRAERAALDREEGAARETIAGAESGLPILEDRRASIDRAWGRVLGAAGVGPDDLDRSPEGARRILESRAADWSARDARRGELDRTIRSGETQAATAAERAAGAAAAVTHAEKEAQAADAEVSRLAAERAGLLDGEATETHRNGHRAACDTAGETFETARATAETARRDLAGAQEAVRIADEAAGKAAETLDGADATFTAALTARDVDRAEAIALLAVPPDEREALRARLTQADEAVREATSSLGHCEKALADTLAVGPPEDDRPTLEERAATLGARTTALDEDVVARRVALQSDDHARKQAGDLEKDIAAAAVTERLWAQMNDAIGSADGSKFRRYAQSITLDHLVALANRHLAALSPRYRLERAAGEGGDLGLQIRDRDLGDECRSTRSLSGGERFLTSLALALALCSLEGRGSFVDTLFIDEGFGTLDAATLDVAIDALEALQAQGRKVGVISHVETMHQRIPVQIRVDKVGGGKSRVRVTGAGGLGGTL